MWGQDVSRARQLQIIGVAVLAVAVVALAVLVFRDNGKADGQNTAGPATGVGPSTSAPSACTEPAKIVLLGDSTRDPEGPGQPLVDALKGDLAGSEVLALGSNGASLAVYRDSGATQQAVAFEPDVVELSIGINDLRSDQSAARAQQFTDDLKAYVVSLHEQLPDAALHLTVPAALSTQDVDDFGFVTSQTGAINPAGAADKVTKSLHKAYLDVAGALDYVDLLDVQEEITGTSADTSKKPKFLSDQIHPNPKTASEIAGLLAEAVSVC